MRKIGYIMLAVGILASAAYAAEGEGAKKERKAPVDRFAEADADGNGSISLAEFKAAHEKRMAMWKERMGDKWDEERAAKRPGAEVIFAKLDADSDGALTKEEMGKARRGRGAGGRGRGPGGPGGGGRGKGPGGEGGGEKRL